MKLAEYLKTWRGTRAENKAQRPLLATLVASNVVLALLLYNQDRTVVVVPPTLRAEAAVNQNRASPEMQQEWAMYLTTLVGNMTPRTAPIVKQQLEGHLTPRLFNQVQEWIDTEIRIIARDNVTLSFSPTVVRFEPRINRVVVTGELVLRGMRGQERRQTRTYEMAFTTSNYKVMLSEFDVYEGGWKRRIAAGEDEEAVEGKE